MDQSPISNTEKEEIRKYFGKSLEEMDSEEFKQLHKELRTKYHPDNFEKFDDETVKEMATERFQQIEHLAERMAAFYNGKTRIIKAEEGFFSPDALFAFDKMKIEVITSDKDLKYHLFGTAYRWLLYGDKFKIPGSQASIIIDEDHRGSSIGYRETIRMYLTFGINDATEDIVAWLYDRIQGRASSLIIHGEIVKIEPMAMLNAIKRTAILEIGSGEVD
ncbi:MAG: hypothetical protein DHS20C18_07160 [Saprospiraceae bacterium]|nr:MAG: hypothetical protein DHS20C18_07160 [Saprospiraceae bacterium]